ncbi:MAG: tRNA (adenosine(37)-N6)-threonylcarbamoyltransferase complex dimerization subunit type 1 TsaB [Planctomycetes bacterium]|nr:tRNA (adenosine(37)-N6)-threonylcarbamoyltransferase complex dimerization subunit type 1 TsaB [Planctomycetota bacterium]
MSERASLAISGSNLTGEHAFTCCLRTGDGLRTACPEPGQRGDLARLALDLLSSAGVAPADLDELRVDLGPGSYTGLRVAITFARFLQHFGGVEVLACDSLALMASAAVAEAPRLRPILDARRGRFHCATLLPVDGRLRHHGEPAAVTFDELATTVTTADTFVAPSTLAVEHVVALRALGANVVEVTAISAAQLFCDRLELATCTSAELEPRYLMASYAE